MDERLAKPRDGIWRRHYRRESYEPGLGTLSARSPRKIEAEVIAIGRATHDARICRAAEQRNADFQAISCTAVEARRVCDVRPVRVADSRRAYVRCFDSRVEKTDF